MNSDVIMEHVGVELNMNEQIIEIQFHFIVCITGVIATGGPKLDKDTNEPNH